MGQMVEGEWVSEMQALSLKNGKYVRPPSRFRSFISSDSPQDFTPSAGRYHLYVSLQCPWAWRTIVYRRVKELMDAIGMSIAIPDGREEGWRFGRWGAASTEDGAEGFTHLYEAYRTADPNYTGIVSVPVLWDRQTRTIVNNESSDIIRILNFAFDQHTCAKQDYYPEPLRGEIDVINDRVYRGLNNAVYRAGAAASQAAYEEAYAEVFSTLDWLDADLAEKRYITGPVLTESDWKIAASLFRFDPVYHSLFRCNKRTVASYVNLSAYLRDIYQQPGVAETIDVRQIVTGYYSQTWNPSGIVPAGPEYFEEWLAQPHDRSRLA